MMYQHPADLKTEEMGAGCVPVHQHPLVDHGRTSLPPPTPESVSSSNSGFWRDMLYSNAGMIKIEPNVEPAPVEGTTRIENNNFDHYRNLLDLDSKHQHQHHVDRPHHIGRGAFHLDRYYSDPGGGESFAHHLAYDSGGGVGSGYQVEMQSPTTMSGGEMSPSSSPPPLPRTYKPCVVCNDKSSGYHYGVSSCEGCKGFFRRSVQKNMQYTCHKDKSCVINKVTRNRCQYCRLQKCFSQGMSKEGLRLSTAAQPLATSHAVRNDRNKKRKQQPKQDNCSSSTTTPDDLVTSEEETIIQRLVKAHRETYTINDNDEQYKLRTVEDVEKCTSLLWEQISELSTSGIVRIVEFGKRIPGFTTLSTTDQITLLKAACLEVMLLRLGARYQEEDDTIRFSNTLCLSEKQLEVGGFGAFTQTIFKFAKSLSAMAADETEFALLAAISLMSGDRYGLERPERVEQLQEPILEALKHYVRRRRPDQPHCFAKMLLKLTDLRCISVKGAERVLHLRLEMPGELPPLILEMLDRAENVCIP